MGENRSVSVPVMFARRMPDPLLGESASRHILLVRIKDLPEGLPLDPNPRKANTSKRIYKEIAQSLRDDDVTVPGTFHLKHKGITIIADAVDKIDENLYRLSFRDGQGLVDGGHTYQLIHETMRKDPDLIPDQQWIKFEVLTGVPAELITDIAGGLNTGLQVRPESLDNLAGLFEGLKGAISGRSYADKIAWVENDDAPVSVIEVISLLTACNIGLYPNSPGAAAAMMHPVQAYEKKSAALKAFEVDQQKPTGDRTYDKMLGIMPDILELYDLIRKEAQGLWAAAPENRNSRFGGWSFVEHKSRGQFTFWFLPEGENTYNYRLVSAAAYPILAAFRRMIEVDPVTGNYRWRGGFESVKRLWRETAVDLLRTTYQVSVELGRNPNAIGKSRPHWANIYNLVAMRELEDQLAKSTAS